MDYVLSIQNTVLDFRKKKKSSTGIDIPKREYSDRVKKKKKKNLEHACLSII